MKKSGGFAAFAGAIIALAIVVAWASYARLAGPRPTQPVPQVTAGPVQPAPERSLVPMAAPSGIKPPTPSPIPGTGPVVYLPQSVSAPTPGPTATPFVPIGGSATVGVEPMVAATVAPHVLQVEPIIEPANAPPRILAMSMSTPVAHAGEVVSGTVETSSNVASVEARIAGYSSSMRKLGIGRFVMSYRVPNLPFFLRRTYTIEVIARNTRGDAVRTSVPITIR
ncbi:MAG TPA: hypothetical protein VKT72_15265 [Candidatus Baltobacteraceae bacterium]|nr:hypothetical protein [Candidatus Baltobacteraceae bacterium]